MLEAQHITPVNVERIANSMHQIADTLKDIESHLRALDSIDTHLETLANDGVIIAGVYEGEENDD